MFSFVHEPRPRLVHFIVQEKEAAGGARPPVSRKTIISRGLDNALQEVMELVCRDFILNWYQRISSDQTTLMNSIQ